MTTYQVVEGEVADLRRFNVEVLECLGCWINMLVDELLLDLIGGNGSPPKVLVEVRCKRFHKAFRDVDMFSLFDDFLIDKLRDLSGGIVLWSVQLVGLASGCVIVEHIFESSSNINCLHGTVRLGLNIQLKGDYTYVNRPESLLHVVRDEFIRHLRQLVKKVILESKHGSGSDNGCLREDASSNSFTISLIILLSI